MSELKNFDFSVISQDDIPDVENKKALINQVKAQKLQNFMKAIESTAIREVECCERAGINYGSYKSQKSLGTIGWKAIDKLSNAFFEIAKEQAQKLLEAQNTFMADNGAVMKDLLEKTQEAIDQKKSLKKKLEEV